MIFSANVLKRWSFQKIKLENDPSCIIRKDDISFPRKYDLILYMENTWKYDIFFIFGNDGILPFY